MHRKMQETINLEINTLQKVIILISNFVLFYTKKLFLNKIIFTQKIASKFHKFLQYKQQITH